MDEFNLNLSDESNEDIRQTTTRRLKKQSESEKQDIDEPLAHIKASAENIDKYPHTNPPKVDKNTSLPKKNKKRDSESNKKERPSKKAKASRKSSDDGFVDYINDDDDFKKSKIKKSKKNEVIPEMIDVESIIHSVFGESDDESVITDTRDWDELSALEDPTILQAKADLKKIITYRRKILRERKASRNASYSDLDDDVVDDSNILPNGVHRRCYNNSNRRVEHSNKKSQRDEIIEAERSRLISEFLDIMKLACQADRTANQNKKPALNKLSLINQFKEGLLRTDWQYHLLDVGILSVVKDWLEPLPDRTLPSQEIRLTLLNCLLRFPGINTNHLKTSSLGKIINYYSREETNVDIRNLAEKLLSTWISHSLGNDDSNGRRFTERLTPEQSILHSQQVLIGRRVKDKSKPTPIGRPKGPQFASAPLVVPMDFIKKPKNNIFADDDRRENKPKRGEYSNFLSQN